MIRRGRRGVAFWLFLVVVAVGLGWAATQDWRWPSFALFDGESDEQAQGGPELAQQPAQEQPQVEQPGIEGAPVEEPGSETSAAQPSDAPAEAEPAATDPAMPSEQAAQTPAPAADTEERAAVPEQARQPGQGTGAGGADPTPEPREAEVAAIEPAAPGSPVPHADPERLAPPAEAAIGEPPRDSPEETRDATPSAGTAEGSGQTTSPPTDAPPASTEATVKPSFDVVRVEPDGRAVIAGRAAPGAEVELRSRGQVIDRVQASRRGEWVAIPAEPLAPGDQQLSAVATDGGTAPVESDQVVVVAVPGSTSPAPAAVAAETTEPAQPVAVLLPRQGKGTGRILQAPGRLSADGTLALMTVSYDESGEVLLSGEAPPGAPVRIYVDNRPAALVVGDAKGAWTSSLGEALKPGTYTLRFDQLDAKGQPVARLETPFTRVSKPPVEGDLQVDYVVVQPGNSLWRIARRLSGKGVDYVHIHGANQAQIRDPDLIYPGQVFEIPARVGSAG
jgi:nucleoid-associated protein YgaU